MMYIDRETGLLSIATYLPSLHYDNRPASTAINMIVIHGISLPPAEFGTTAIEQFFCGQLDFSAHPYFLTIKDLRVSAHLLIKRQGEITQFVPFHQRAWHAGQSFFQGKSHCNDFSVGIELEGTDDIPYTEEQYQQLAKVIWALQITYPDIIRERIVGHSDIAPGRKTDPGSSFDWTYLDAILDSLQCYG